MDAGTNKRIIRELELIQTIAHLLRKAGEADATLDQARDDAERKELLKSLFAEVYFRGDSITAFTFAPDLLPHDGGESFAGIANGLVSLHEPLRLDEAEDPVPDGMMCCSKCGDTRPLDQFYRKSRHGSDSAKNRVAKCKKCQNLENAERRKRRNTAKTKE